SQLTGGRLTVNVEMGKCMDGNRVVYSYAVFRFSNGTTTTSTCSDTTWWSGCRYYAPKDRVHISPKPQTQTRLVGLERLGTLFLPGEAIAAPLFNSSWGWAGDWVIRADPLHKCGEYVVAHLYGASSGRDFYVSLGRDVRQLNVTLPVNWSRGGARYVKGSVMVIPRNATELSMYFPRVVGGVPGLPQDTYYLIGLAAWDPYKSPLAARLGLGRGSWDTGCWLSNGTTLAVYNLTYTYTFKNGTMVVFLQPVVVSALKVKDVQARYVVGSFDAERQHRPILATLTAEITWAYLPSQSDSQKLGIKLHPPRQELTAALVVAGRPLLVAGGRSESGNSLLFTFSFESEWLVEALDWRLTPARLEVWWLGAYGQPQGPVDEQQAMDLYLVPGIAYALEWEEASGFK
ncbi:MAG: hypothetical protein ACPL2E_08225, partial [Conexivisphaera sp.]